MESNLKAPVKLEGEFTALELEEIIGTLARVRAGLLPAVPTAPSKDMDREVLVQDDALFTIRTLANGGARIWLRNDGLGWLAFTLSADKLTSLKEFLGKKLGHTHTIQ